MILRKVKLFSYKLFKLDKKSAMALSRLFITPEKELENKKISDVLPEEFWETNFWLYWQTMFAFQKWSSASVVCNERDYEQ